VNSTLHEGGGSRTVGGSRLMDYAWAALAGIRLADDMARLVCRPEDIDDRIRGLGLCTLAVLLLSALGWIGWS